MQKQVEIVKKLGFFKKKDSFLIKILHESRLFIFFSFCSCVIPIISCLISTNIKPNGSQSIKSKENTIFSSTIWMSFFLGIIMTIFYVLSSFLYIYFSNNKSNTQIIFNLKAIIIGIGLTISIIISIFISFITINSINYITIYLPYQVRDLNILISKIVLKEYLTSISLSIFKRIAIVAVVFTIPLTINEFTPLEFKMSRVLWFNMMYFIPFILIGIREDIRAHYLTHENEKICSLNHYWKKNLTIIIITLLFTFFLSFRGIFLISPLAKIYVKNDYNPFKNNEFPEIKGWENPSLPSNEIIQIDKLENNILNEFPVLDKLKPLTENQIKDALIKLENIIIIKNNLQKIDQWTITQLQNNSDEVKYVVKNLSDWIKWFNQANDNGVILIDFLEQKNNINVTESFINLRQLMNYYDFIKKYTINNQLNIKELLLNNRIIDILPSLFLKIQTFNSKSIIYISVFSSLNSVWTILLKINVRNYKKGMPYWFMVFTYFLCIVLVTFGVLFGVTLADKPGTNNQFKYLNVWTFLLIAIAIFVIFVVTTKSIKSYKFISKNRK